MFGVSGTIVPVYGSRRGVRFPQGRGPPSLPHRVAVSQTEVVAPLRRGSTVLDVESGALCTRTDSGKVTECADAARFGQDGSSSAAGRAGIGSSTSSNACGPVGIGNS